jgi:hypothetical protein
MSEAKKEFKNLLDISINRIVSRIAESRNIPVEEATRFADKQGIFKIAEEMQEEFLKMSENEEGCDCGEIDCEDCEAQGRNAEDWENHPKSASKEHVGESKLSLAMEKIIISKALSRNKTGDK